jgi:hypothetical protein
MLTRILLNSLWGKFGQRNQLMQNRVIKSPDDYFKLLLDKKIRVSRIIPLGDEIIRVNFEDKKPFVHAHNASNVIIALWTTRYYTNIFLTCFVKAKHVCVFTTI